MRIKAKAKGAMRMRTGIEAVVRRGFIILVIEPCVVFCHTSLIGLLTGVVAVGTGIISSGLLKPADALALLRIGPEFTQTAVKSLKALQNLTWTGSQRITDATYYRELVRKEEAEYQKLFAEYMSKVM